MDSAYSASRLHLLSHLHKEAEHIRQHCKQVDGLGMVNIMMCMKLGTAVAVDMLCRIACLPVVAPPMLTARLPAE